MRFILHNVTLDALNTESLKELCKSFSGCIETLYPDPENILVYSVGGKTFAYFKTSEPERWRFSIRVSPDRFIELTDMPGVKPARYCGRYHWITLVDVQKFPEAYLVELLDWSYHKACQALSAVARRRLTET